MPRSPAAWWATALPAGLLLVSVATGCARAPQDEPAPLTAAPPAANQVAGNPLRDAWFGDLHVHSSWSLDAFQLGGDRDHPSLAYRFGRGERITKANGRVHQLAVPLDFMAVTDHDVWLGEVHACTDADDPAYDTPACRAIRNSEPTFLMRGRTSARGRRPPEICGESGMTPRNRCYERSRHLWQEIQQDADAFYEPGRFTTFPAYEWTSTPRRRGGVVHMHRNVIFNGRSVPEWGGSAAEMQNRPERLWDWLARACTGDCQVVAIPHNTNLAGGMAFSETVWTPHTPDMLRLRAWAEPLIEIHQVKGNSECYRGLGTTDEECNFENFQPICEGGREAGCAHASDYVRNALKAGLRLEADYGVNPFKFGLLASTDDHQGLPGATEEDDFTDKPVRRAEASFNTGAGGPLDNPGGLVGVWAEENTRDSIFAALKRKETFGTSGPRIRVRFFAGWDYPADLHARRDLVETAYRGGVPMGADLPARPAQAAAPRFVVWATRWAGSANLQKVQVIKGWADAEGATHEQVFDVVCADGIEPDPGTWRCADNGARVDLSDCSHSSDLGAAELSTTWTDPGFDPALRAFYYARVLENPTCRWTSHRALARGEPLPEPAVTKERAWSSPIWHTPGGE